MEVQSKIGFRLLFLNMVAKDTLLPIEDNYVYSYLEQLNIFYVLGYKNVDLQKTIDIIIKVKEDSLFNSRSKVVVDLSEISYHPSFSELMKIKDTVVLLKNSFKSKIAFLGQSFHKILLDLFCIYCNNSGMTAKAFVEEAELEEWIMK